MTIDRKDDGNPSVSERDGTKAPEGDAQTQSGQRKNDASGDWRDCITARPAPYRPHGFEPSTHSQRIQFRHNLGRTDKTSRFIGVSRKGRRYVAGLINRSAGKKQRYIGSFRNQRSAAVAYDLVALATHGKDARTNFPSEAYTRLVGSEMFQRLGASFADKRASSQSVACEAVRLLADLIESSLPG